MFYSVKSIPGFDIDWCITIVNMEKSIEYSFRKTMTSAKVFLGAGRINRNMLATISAERARDDGLYDRAVQVSSKTMANAWQSEYGPRQRSYLDLFEALESYMASSPLEERTFTSQRSESQMWSSVRNLIREVEPQLLQQKVVKVQRKRFNEN